MKTQLTFSLLEEEITSLAPCFSGVPEYHNQPKASAEFKLSSAVIQNKPVVPPIINNYKFHPLRINFGLETKGNSSVLDQE